MTAMVGILRTSSTVSDDELYPENHETPSLWFERVQERYKGQKRRGIKWASKDPVVHKYFVEVDVYVESTNDCRQSRATSRRPPRVHTVGARDLNGRTFVENVKEAIESDLVDTITPKSPKVVGSACGSPSLPIRRPSLDFDGDGSGCMAEFENLWEDASASFDEDILTVGVAPTSSSSWRTPTTPSRGMTSLKTRSLSDVFSKRSSSTRSVGPTVQSSGCEDTKPPTVGVSAKSGLSFFTKKTEPKPSTASGDSSETDLDELSDSGSSEDEKKISDSGSRKRFAWLRQSKKTKVSELPVVQEQLPTRLEI